MSDAHELAPLEAFVLARLDKVESVARSAGKDGGRFWDLVASERGDGAIYDDMGNPVLTYDTEPSTGLPSAPQSNPLGARQAAHIALNDPGMAMDWVEAQRGLLLLLRETPSYEKALKLCAEPFRAHPGCRPEWRPAPQNGS